MNADAPERLACRRCVRDRQLRAEIATDGFEAPCDYCGRPGLCVDAAWLADRIHSALQSAFVPADDAAAAEPIDLLQHACGLPAALAVDVQQRLVALYRDADGAALYGDGRRYAERPPTHVPYADWPAFAAAACDEGAAAADALLRTLKWAFAHADALQTPKGRPARRLLAAGRRAFRARREPFGADGARDDERTEPAPDAPHREVAAAPARAAFPFDVLALDARTAIADLRPPRDAAVVVERGAAARPLALFDADAARKALHRTHCFVPDRADRRARAAFVAGFADACREAPVSSTPQDAAALRWVAAWLADGERRWDGIVVRSAFGAGRRLLLFPAAAATGAFVAERRRRYVIARLRLDCRRTRDGRTRPARD